MKLIAIWLLNLFDYIMTLKQVNKYDADIEANPIMRYFLGDKLAFFIVKILLVSIWLLILWQSKDTLIVKVGVWVLLGVYGAVAIYHIFLYFKKL